MLKQQLLALAEFRRERVEFEGATFFVREASTQAFAEYGKVVQTDKAGALAGLFAECIEDEAGEKLFTAVEAAQLAKVARVASKLLSVVMRISGQSEDTEEKHS